MKLLIIASYEYTHSFNNRELQTTDTEDIAIARLAIQGWSVTPNGTNAPAASGIPMIL